MALMARKWKRHSDSTQFSALLGGLHLPVPIVRAFQVGAGKVTGEAGGGGWRVKWRWGQGEMGWGKAGSRMKAMAVIPLLAQ